VFPAACGTPSGAPAWTPGAGIMLPRAARTAAKPMLMAVLIIVVPKSPRAPNGQALLALCRARGLGGSCPLTRPAEMCERISCEERMPLLALRGPKPRHRGLVHLDPQSGAKGKRDTSIAHGQRVPHQVLGEIEVREAHAPIDGGDRAGEVHG